MYSKRYYESSSRRPERAAKPRAGLDPAELEPLDDHDLASLLDDDEVSQLVASSFGSGCNNRATFERRCKLYEAGGLEVSLPASPEHSYAIVRWSNIRSRVRKALVPEIQSGECFEEMMITAEEFHLVNFLNLFPLVGPQPVAVCEGSLMCSGEMREQCTYGIELHGVPTGRLSCFPLDGTSGYGKGNSPGCIRMELDHGKTPNTFELTIDGYTSEWIKAGAKPADGWRTGIRVPEDFIAQLFGCTHLAWRCSPCHDLQQSGGCSRDAQRGTRAPEMQRDRLTRLAAALPLADVQPSLEESPLLEESQCF